MFPQPEFSVGVNLPWIEYGCDFGANAWFPRGGVSTRGVPAGVQQRTLRLSAHGVRTLRWFVFCDGRAGIRFGDGEEPLGLDDYVLADLDAALDFMSAIDMRIVLTLFDFLWCAPRTSENGVQMGGRARAVEDPRHRRLLLDRVVRPVLHRYARTSAVAAWDLMNEPEWVAKRRGPRPIREFVTETAGLVHEIASQPATVGLASSGGLSLVRDAGLDFYQLHWYDKLGQAMLERSVDSYGLDKPIVLGEFPTRGSRLPPAEILALARRAGYSAAWLWSAMAGDRATDLDAALAGLPVPSGEL